MTKAIQLGATYRDVITGFEGVATGHVTYLSGCNQALLAPRVGADGALRDPQWFDEQRLVQQPAPLLALDNSRTPGSDKAAPRR